MTPDTRYHRQELLFGREGQRLLSNTRISVVGLGGLGSHVAQQLAFLGVADFALVDADEVSLSNLNRLIGGTEDDVDARKVDVAARHVRTIQHHAAVSAAARNVESAGSQAALRSSDVVFGCIDNDLGRLRLIELCSELGIPYIDLASDTGTDDGKPWYGGRVLMSFFGDGCLACRGLLDQREIARSTMTPDQLAEDDRLYGLDPGALDESGPSVVSINGVVASVAVTEFMAWVTKLRKPWPHLIYRGDLGRLSLSNDAPKADCYYCTRFGRATKRE